MTRRFVVPVLLAVVLSGCIGPPFYGPSTVGFDETKHGWPAVDFWLPRGTPLRAVANSRVVQVGYEAPNAGDPYGCPPHPRTGEVSPLPVNASAYCGAPDRFVVIRLGHEDDGCRRLAYKHLDRVDVVQGQWLTEGQVIGRSGNDLTVNPHLHFDCQPDDTSQFNWKPTALDYPIIESCYRGRWTIHSSDTLSRGDRVTFGPCR